MKGTNTRRRKLLTAIGAVSLATVAGVGAGIKEPVRYTKASTETECEDFTLRAEWRETYTRDGETTLREDSTDENAGEETTSAEPSIIALDGVLPGDSGTVSVRLEVDADSESDSVDVEPEFKILLDGIAENGINEPEEKAGDTSEDAGELQEFLDVRVWKDNGLFGIDSLGADNLEPNLGEQDIDSGTLEEVAVQADEEGYRLGPIEDGETTTVTMTWEFDPDNGSVNVTQGDSVTFAFDIHAECS